MDMYPRHVGRTPAARGGRFALSFVWHYMVGGMAAGGPGGFPKIMVVNSLIRLKDLRLRKE